MLSQGSSYSSSGFQSLIKKKIELQNELKREKSLIENLKNEEIRLKTQLAQKKGQFNSNSFQVLIRKYKINELLDIRDEDDLLSQLRDLKETQKKRQDKISELKEELEHRKMLNIQAANLSASHHKFQNKIQEKEESIQQQEEDISRLKEMIDSVDRRIEKVGKEKASIEAEYKTLESLIGVSVTDSSFFDVLRRNLSKTIDRSLYDKCKELAALIEQDIDPIEEFSFDSFSKTVQVANIQLQSEEDKFLADAFADAKETQAELDAQTARIRELEERNSELKRQLEAKDLDRLKKRVHNEQRGIRAICSELGIKPSKDMDRATKTIINAITDLYNAPLPKPIVRDEKVIRHGVDVLERTTKVIRASNNLLLRRL